jgi:transmembrane sensor
VFINDVKPSMSGTELSIEITPEVLSQAADWLVKTHDRSLSSEEQQAFIRWRDACPEHQQAWLKAEKLTKELYSLPPSLAMPALQRQRSDRRTILKKSGLLLLLGTTGWGSWRLASNQAWTADFRTATGEQREITLADGTQLKLNTASAVNVHYTHQQRLLVLLQGEVLIKTAKDPNGRPFMVKSEQGLMQALGTVFNVRQKSSQTMLTVLEGKVKIQPDLTPQDAQIISAGQQSVFTESTISSIEKSTKAATAWSRGMIVADNMPLTDFVSELNRYHQGVLRCSADIVEVKVLGSYPSANITQTLNMLAATYPIRWTSRMGGYWITVEPK